MMQLMKVVLLAALAAHAAKSESQTSCKADGKCCDNSCACATAIFVWIAPRLPSSNIRKFNAYAT